MISIQPPMEDFDADIRSAACRDAVEVAMHGLISEAETKGWRPAEVAMALADVAEDYVLLLARNQVLKH